MIDANDLAEEILEIDETNVKATYAKAEALYYNCEFEQALVIYYRGSVSLYCQVIYDKHKMTYNPNFSIYYKLLFFFHNSIA